MNETKLNALRGKLSSHPHTDKRFDSLADWMKAGSPYCWELYETKKSYAGFIDSSYGLLALFKDDILLGYGSFEVITEEVLLIDSEFYGVKTKMYFK